MVDTEICNVHGAESQAPTIARSLIIMRSKHDHITPALIQLHWLPIQQRVTYKLATLTFKTLSSDKPSYLRSLLITHQPARNLRSSTLNLLTVTSPRTSLSSRAFRHSATAIRNNIPAVIRGANSLHVLKRRLKTHLFTVAFNTELYSLVIVIISAYN